MRGEEEGKGGQNRRREEVNLTLYSFGNLRSLPTVAQPSECKEENIIHS